MKKQIYKGSRQAIIKIAICDDEQAATSEIEELLLACGKRRDIKVETTIFQSGKLLEESIKQGNRYDAIYLDIEMEDQDGLVTAANIRKLYKNVLLIYISAYENYIEDIFEVDPFRFIKKPINKEKFIAVFDLVYKKLNDTDMYFKYVYKKMYRRVPMDDIMYFESRGRVVAISMRDGSEEFMFGTIDDLELEMKSRKVPFMRIHQSYLVNFNGIASKKHTELYVANGQCLSISRGRQKHIDEEYCRLMGGDIIG